MSKDSGGMQDDSAVARYVALDAGGEAGAGAGADVPPPNAAELDIFARCDAVLAVAPRLADSPELAWAYAEARQLARAAPPAAEVPPWYRRIGIAWSAAALSTATAAALAVFLLLPPADDAALTADDTALPSGGATSPSFATAISAAELADRITRFEPFLIGETVAVDGRSLVVLPFAKGARSSKPEATAKAEPADALYGRLVRQLSAMPGLYVIDPATAAIYADGAYSPEEIALFLGVRGVAQGDVRADGDTIYLDFRFTDAAGAGRAIDLAFERPIEELSMLQNDVAQSLIEALGEAPTPVELQP